MTIIIAYHHTSEVCEIIACNLRMKKKFNRRDAKMYNYDMTIHTVFPSHTSNGNYKIFVACEKQNGLIKFKNVK